MRVPHTFEPRRQTGTEKKFHILKKITSVPKKTSDDRKRNSFCMVIQKEHVYKPQPGLRILIRSIIGRWIRIRIRVKSRIRIKVTIHKLYRLKTEPWRADDARNGGLEAQNGPWRVYTLKISCRRFPRKVSPGSALENEKLGPDPR